MQQPQTQQDAQTQPSIQYPTQQQMAPQVMLCPLQYVYDPQQVLVPSEEHVQPAQPVQQPQPIQHQTYIINVQNPPPWIQNRTNMVYMPQVVNNVPYLNQNMVQNPMINYQYQPMIIQQDIRQLPMTQLQNQNLINHSLLQQQNLLQKQQSLLQNQQNSQASQATKILQAQQIQNQQRIIQNSQNLVQNQQLMQTAQIVQSPQRITSQSITHNQPKMMTQQSFIINQQDALIKNAQTLVQNSQIPTQVVRQKIQTPQLIQNPRMMLIPQSMAQSTLAKQKATPVLAQILQTKAQPVNQTEMMTPMIITKPVNQTDMTPITLKPQYHMPQMIAVNSLANYSTQNGPNSPNDTTVPQAIRNQIPEGLSVKTILTKAPITATVRPNPLDDPRTSKPLMKNSTTNTETSYKRKILEKKVETPAKKAKVDNRLNEEAAKARLEADRQQNEEKLLRNTVYVQARGRINETGESSRGNASVSTECTDPSILALSNIFVNTNNFKIGNESLPVAENTNHENPNITNGQPNVLSESVNASIENTIENVVRQAEINTPAKKNDATVTENIQASQNSVQNLLSLPIETQIIPIETQIQPSETKILPKEPKILPSEPKIQPKEPKILPSEPKKLPKEHKIRPNEPKILTKEHKMLPNEPKILPNVPKILTNEPKILPNVPKILTNEPKILPNVPKILTNAPKTLPNKDKPLSNEPEKLPNEPQIFPNEIDNNKSLNDMKMALESMNRTTNSAADVITKKIDKCEKENSVKDKKKLLNDNVKKKCKQDDGRKLEARVMREKVERFVLTHVLDGHIIQESNVPFVVQKSSIPLYRNPQKVIQTTTKEEKPANDSSDIKSEEEASSISPNKDRTQKTENIKNNVKPKENETGGPSRKETRLNAVKTENKKEKESRKVELSKSKEKERQSNRIQLRQTSERERESRRITEREDRLLSDNDKCKKEKAEVPIKKEKRQDVESTKNETLKTESKEIKSETIEKSEIENHMTENEDVKTKTELDSETVYQETEENPFEKLDIATVKLWTATTLYDHLNHYNWHETAQKLHDEEIDGESLLLVNTDQLSQIGIRETHASILGAFIENEKDV